MSNLSARRLSKLAGVAAIGLLAVASPASAASLVQYNFANNSGNEASEAPSLVAANLTGLNFTRGGGLNALAGSGAFNSSAWGVYTRNADDYLTFGFNVAAGYTATIDQLVFGSRSSNTGPRSLAVLAAVDGGAFQQVATFAQTGDAVVNRMLSLTPQTALSSIVFRIVNTSGTSANGGALANGGTFRVQNYAGAPATPFSINGAVTALPAAVPEPASWAMLLVGFGVTGATIRRRKAATAHA